MAGVCELQSPRYSQDSNGHEVDVRADTLMDALSSEPPMGAVWPAIENESIVLLGSGRYDVGFQAGYAEDYWSRQVYVAPGIYH